MGNMAPMHHHVPLLLTLGLLPAAELHVTTQGDDAGPGTSERPFRTIQQAAQVAQPGDTVTVHAGIYRERIDPPRGGTGPDARITYRAAPGEEVDIRGSEVVTGWAPVGDDVWRVSIPAERFGKFNPFADVLQGDWFLPEGLTHHSGAVYCDGRWLGEAASPTDLRRGPTEAWWAEAGPSETIIHARFPGIDPNQHLTEIAVRQTVFYPSRPGRDWITVRGFRLRHAATPWAPPTAEQIGLIGTHWSRGWIIEDNTVTHSMCAGITLGKYGDTHDNAAGTAEGYLGTIRRAQAYTIPWDRDHIGGHVVRRNTVAFCEQAGICGSLGAIFSTISDNEVHHIHARRRFGGYEQAAIKFHAAIDTVISGNHLHDSYRGLWLDWMNQGTLVTGNIMHDHHDMDLFLEVNHGPFVVADNLLLSPLSLTDMSQGGAFVHNLFGGRLTRHSDQRLTPFHPPHDTTIAGLAAIAGGGHRFFNNVFVGRGTPRDALTKPPASDHQTWGLAGYDDAATPVQAAGNIYLAHAQPLAQEYEAIVLPDKAPTVNLDADQQRLVLTFAAPLPAAATVPVTGERLGTTAISHAGFTFPDGRPFVAERDLLGQVRSPTRPVAGPVETTTSAVVIPLAAHHP